MKRLCAGFTYFGGDDKDSTSILVVPAVQMHHQPTARPDCIAEDIMLDLIDGRVPKDDNPINGIQVIRDFRAALSGKSKDCRAWCYEIDMDAVSVTEQEITRELISELVQGPA